MIGNVIQKKRKEVGLTQAQLAERLGVTAPAVNRWEKDLSFPDVALLAPLARCLKTDLNELFSFYSSLSDKERQLIVDNAHSMVLYGKQEEALTYIDTVIQNNLSDGQLYLDLAEMLLGFHAFKKTSAPMIYLGRIAEYYERAMKLLPERVDDISHSLITVYAEMGNRTKAEEAWAHLPAKSFDKKWAHAEMLYTLKDYDAALSEIRRMVLDKILNLSHSLSFLGDTLYLNGDNESSELAEQLNDSLCKLFGLWHGINVLNRVTSAIETQPADTDEFNLSDLVSSDLSHGRLTTCPLFKDIVLGGVPDDESTTADILADMMSALKNLH